jgi:hypothetical protein
MRDLEETGEAIVITLSGETKAVMQDIRQYEKTQESLAVLNPRPREKGFSLRSRMLIDRYKNH